MKPKSTLKSGKLYYFPIVLFLLLFSALVAIAQPTSQTFNSSGTYTVPVGYSALVTIEAWGGGGGGGSGAGERGGGGGGAYATLTTTLTAGSYTVTVGAGGGVGAAGGASSFFNLVPAIIVSAGGGGSTTTVTGGAAGTGITGTGFIGGTGGNGGNSNSSGGGGGGSATSIANGGNAGNGLNGNNAAGGIGGIGQGNGGAGSVNTNSASAVAGTAPGGGGGGRASNTTTSASGAAGRVIITVNGVLPVKLSNIKAFEKQNGIQLEWTAYSEENLNKYQIERSSDGTVFTSIGEVLSRNSMLETKYSFYDPNPLPGVSFYRLRNVDMDTKFGFSNIVRVSLDKTIKDIRLYPNPVADRSISFQSSDLAKGNYAAKVFNAAGQQVYLLNFTHAGGSLTQSIQLPLSVKPGIHTLQLENDGVKVMSKGFVVQ